MTDDKLIVYTGGVLTKGVAEAEDAAAAAAAAAELAGDEADRAEVAAGDAQDAADALSGAIDDIATAQETADEAGALAQEAKDEAERSQLPPFTAFAARAQAALAEIGDLPEITVAGIGRYRQVPAPFAHPALVSGDGRLFVPDGDVTPQHWGDGTAGNNWQIHFNSAITYLNAIGGGELVIPDREYRINGPIILKSNVHMRGCGRPVLRLLSGSNCSVIQTESYTTLAGTNEPGGEQNFSIRNIRCECWRTVNTSPPENEGHGVAIYGRDWVIDNVYINQARRNGFIAEYTTLAGGLSPYNGRIGKLTVMSSGENGVHNMVSDIHIDTINVASSGLNDDGGTYAHIRFGPAGNCRISKLSTWSFGSVTAYPDYAVWIHSPSVMIGRAIVADAKTACMFVESTDCQISAKLVGPKGTDCRHLILAGVRNKLELNAVDTSGETLHTCVQIGTATSAARTNDIDITLNGTAEAALVDYVNSAGNNEIKFRGTTGSTVLRTGTPHATDELFTRFDSGVLPANGNPFFPSPERWLKAGGTTSDATPTDLSFGYTQSLPLNTAYVVEATVLGRQEGGASRFGAVTRAVVSRATGAASLMGAASTDVINAVGSWGATIVASGNGFAVQVTGSPSSSVKWIADIKITEVRA